MLERYIGSRAFEDYADQLSVYAVHPGNITTAGSIGAMQGLGLDPETTPMPDSLELAAATILWLTARNAEWLSGRSVSFFLHAFRVLLFHSYVQAPWDLNEVMEKKEEIVRDNLLVTKLAGPGKQSK